MTLDFLGLPILAIHGIPDPRMLKSPDLYLGEGGATGLDACRKTGTRLCPGRLYDISFIVAPPLGTE